MTTLRTIRRRALGGLAALGIVAATLAVAASPAAASDPACNYDDHFNACLRIEEAGFGHWHAYVGIDLHMPQAYAQEIINCGANFRAELWGDDGNDGEDDFLHNMILLPGWPVAGPNDLSAEFVLNWIVPSDLDEDDGRDEIYARVKYDDCHIQQTVRRDTSNVVGYF